MGIILNKEERGVLAKFLAARKVEIASDYVEEAKTDNDCEMLSDISDEFLAANKLAKRLCREDEKYEMEDVEEEFILYTMDGSGTYRTLANMGCENPLFGWILFNIYRRIVAKHGLVSLWDGLFALSDE